MAQNDLTSHRGSRRLNTFTREQLKDSSVDRIAALFALWGTDFEKSLREDFNFVQKSLTEWIVMFLLVLFATCIYIGNRDCMPVGVFALLLVMALGVSISFVMASRVASAYMQIKDILFIKQKAVAMKMLHHEFDRSTVKYDTLQALYDLLGVLIQQRSKASLTFRGIPLSTSTVMPAVGKIVFGVFVILQLAMRLNVSVSVEYHACRFAWE